MSELNEKITMIKTERKKHSKASEEYIHVVFDYENDIALDIWVPVVYRRTGLSLTPGSTEEIEYLNQLYEEINPTKLDVWRKAQNEFWKTKPRATVTKSFFDALAEGGWKCVNCDLPSNPNWARRIQDLKEFGYTIATDTNRRCANCEVNKTHLLLLPVRRNGIGNTGYETWSPALRKRIIKVLGEIDVYENRKNTHSLPDHKFSEIRWDDETKEENSDDMTDKEIKNKFQLLSNQRNQQKREVCRKCFQTNERGTIFGIEYFYSGGKMWPEDCPTQGKLAEAGCVGCPWYDIDRWRNELQNLINNELDISNKQS
jgi:hypothetical protein